VVDVERSALNETLQVEDNILNDEESFRLKLLVDHKHEEMEVGPWLQKDDYLAERHKLHVVVVAVDQ